MERPEVLDAGTVTLTGFNTQAVLESIEIAVRDWVKIFRQIIRFRILQAGF